MIRVINLKNYQLKENELLFKIDRSSVVGNPFIMRKEEDRLKVCEQYEDYFQVIINKDTSRYEEFHLTEEFVENFLNYLRVIYKKAKTNDIVLGCWCYPKRCHGYTIKSFLEKFI